MLLGSVWKRARRQAAVVKEAPAVFVVALSVVILAALWLSQWRIGVHQSRIEEEWRLKFGGLSIALKEAEAGPQPQWSPKSELNNPHLRRKVFRITDLIQGEPVIRNRTFIECDIYGPAVLLPNPENVLMHRNTFVAGLGFESFFLRLDPAQRVADGVILLDNSHIDHSRFVGVGITGSRSALDLFRKGFEP